MGKHTKDKLPIELEKYLVEKYLKDKYFDETEALRQQNNQLDPEVVITEEWQSFIKFKCKFLEYQRHYKKEKTSKHLSKKSWVKRVFSWLLSKLSCLFSWIQFFKK